MKIGLSYLLIFLLILANSCNSHKKQIIADNFKLEHHVYNGAYKKMFFDAMENHSTAPDFVVFYAVDVENKIEKEICCSTDDLNNNSFIFISEFRDSALVSVNMTSEQYEAIGADKYDLKILNELINKYPTTVIDSVYNDFLQHKYPDLLYEMTNKFSYPYMEHLFIINRIQVYRDCETGYSAMGNKF